MNSTQELFLCSLKQKGGFSTMNSNYIYAGLAIAGILELLEAGYLQRDEKNRIIAGKPFENQIPYLNSIYLTVTGYKKPKNEKDIILDFSTGMGKIAKSITEEIGDSLVKINAATVETDNGFLGAGKKYYPIEAEKMKVIEKIRAEFLESGALSEETIILTALLQKQNLLNDYFSKIENKQLRERLKEMKAEESYKKIKRIIDYIEAVWIAVIV